MNKQALTDADWYRIKKLAIGGSLVGGGAGVTLSLLNYLNSLKEEAFADSSDKDDDTLNIFLPENKVASDSLQEKVAMGYLPHMGIPSSTLGGGAPATTPDR